MEGPQASCTSASRRDTDDCGGGAVHPAAVTELNHAARARQEVAPHGPQRPEDGPSAAQLDTDATGTDRLGDVAAVRDREVEQPHSPVATHVQAQRRETVDDTA